MFWGDYRSVVLLAWFDISVCVWGVGIEETTLEERPERRLQNARPGVCFPALWRAWVQEQSWKEMLKRLDS